MFYKYSYYDKYIKICKYVNGNTLQIETKKSRHMKIILALIFQDFFIFLCTFLHN